MQRVNCLSLQATENSCGETVSAIQRFGLQPEEETG